jgi:hypothetical protein
MQPTTTFTLKYGLVSWQDLTDFSIKIPFILVEHGRVLVKFPSSITLIISVTPMTDFPVGNSNPDSMFLFGFLRLVGFDVEDDIRDSSVVWILDVRRLLSVPTILPFSFSVKVMTISVDNSSVKGVYTSSNAGTIRFGIKIPTGEMKQFEFSSNTENQPHPFYLEY